MKRCQGFAAGPATAAIIPAGGVTALAAENGWEITVYPIRMLVNGDVFQLQCASISETRTNTHALSAKNYTSHYSFSNTL